MSEPNYHKFFFSENLLGIENKITLIFINKPVYLFLSILEINEIVMGEFWCDYVKPKVVGKQICATWIRTAL